MSDKQKTEEVQSLSSPLNSIQKKKMSKGLLIALAIFAIAVFCGALIVGSFLGYRIIKNLQSQTEDNEEVNVDNKEGDTNQFPSETESFEVGPMSVDQSDINKQKVNILYLSEYKGEEILYTKWTDGNVSFQYYGDDYSGDPNEIDFNQLVNSKVLFIGKDGEKILPISFIVAPGKNLIYFVLAIDSDLNSDIPRSTTELFEFEMKENSWRRLYARDIDKVSLIRTWDRRNIDPGINYNGGVKVEDFIEGKFLIMRVPECSICELVAPGKLFILNTRTMQDLLLEEVGDLKYNFDNGTISYKKLEYVDGSCDENEESCLPELVLTGDYIISNLP